MVCPSSVHRACGSCRLTDPSLLHVHLSHVGHLLPVSAIVPLALQSSRPRVGSGAKLTVRGGVVKMTNILHSKAAFLEHAEGCRLTSADRTELVRQGIDDIATLAYALSVPGVTPEDDALRRLLNSADPSAVSMSSLSGLRRFIFEALTLCVAPVSYTHLRAHET